MDTFEDRLILQKAVYLAQEAGVKLGYFYNWYLRGPYSPAVAEDAFSVNVAVAGENDESEAYELADEQLRNLAKIRNLVLVKEETRLKLARRLELLASVHFLIDRKQVSGRDVVPIVERLEKFGKDFNETDVRDALRKLDDCELFSQPNA